MSIVQRNSKGQHCGDAMSRRDRSATGADLSRIHEDISEVRVNAECLLMQSASDFSRLSVREAARRMFEKRIHRIIVADEEKFPLGIITSMDMLGVLSQ